MNKGIKVTGLVVFVLIIDQLLKVWVKTHMEYGEEFNLLGLSWAKVHFVENNGMAFGIALGGYYGKLALSLFRILAVLCLGYYIKLLIRAGASLGLVCSFGLILAGALGNIIDSTFYGLLFSASSFHGGLATMFPVEGGYADLLHGKVVDMLYFPMFRGNFPDWLPFWGGDRFLFFRPVFNIADMAITTGVASIIIFHRSFFSKMEEKQATSMGIPATENITTTAPISSIMEDKGSEKIHYPNIQEHKPKE